MPLFGLALNRCSRSLTSGVGQDCRHQPAPNSSSTPSTLSSAQPAQLARPSGDWPHYNFQHRVTGHFGFSGAVPPRGMRWGQPLEEPSSRSLTGSAPAALVDGTPAYATRPERRRSATRLTIAARDFSTDNVSANFQIPACPGSATSLPLAVPPPWPDHVGAIGQLTDTTVTQTRDESLAAAARKDALLRLVRLLARDEARQHTAGLVGAEGR